MILGILSDTHGKTKTAALAVELLIGQGAQYLIHCGDVGDFSVLDCMAGHPAIFVFGNNDWDHAGLAGYASDIGVVCGGELAKLSFANKLVVVTHGDNDSLINSVLSAQQVDYLLVGHTHVPADTRHGRVRIINPGALQRAAQKTVALLDTETDVLKFHVVPRI